MDAVTPTIHNIINSEVECILCHQSIHEKHSCKIREAVQKLIQQQERNGHLNITVDR